MKIILLGPPGAGKGTLAKMMVDTWGLEHISTGDMFRKLIKEETPLGLKIKNYVESGALVPDEIVVEVVIQRINEIGKDKGFILDGFPRTFNQASILDENLEKLDIRIDKVLNLNSREEVIIQRLGGRRICKVCGESFHVTNVPPKKEGICDSCGGELYQRKDDNSETVRNRLKVYNDQTAELIDYYNKSDLLSTINSDLSMEQTFNAVKEILGVAQES